MIATRCVDRAADLCYRPPRVRAPRGRSRAKREGNGDCPRDRSFRRRMPRTFSMAPDGSPRVRVFATRPGASSRRCPNAAIAQGTRQGASPSRRCIPTASAASPCWAAASRASSPPGRPSMRWRGGCGGPARLERRRWPGPRRSSAARGRPTSSSASSSPPRRASCRTRSSSASPGAVTRSRRSRRGSHASASSGRSARSTDTSRRSTPRRCRRHRSRKCTPRSFTTARPSWSRCAARDFASASPQI